ELLKLGLQEINKGLATELLNLIKSCSPEFFEHLVVQLLLKMGYGGSREDAGRRIGGSGDGGVDGIINEDKLGLDVIYIQAKKWENVVGRPEIQKFIGALHGRHAKKGVFITTSYFSSEARASVENIESRVVLIDGEQLAQFMIDHNVGVSTVETYEIKKIDSDFFSEEQY
ncbi:MAG: restriction endonuclease, partial [Nitrospinae bacterium]|nr:restriction endonuclease [Nitrospinota bacterium]